MRTRLYTLHERKGEVRAVSDGFDLLALILPPVWAAWHGLWLTLVAYCGLVAVAAFAWSPLAAPVVGIGLALILGLEGAGARRAELGLRGWRPAGVVEAGSAAGAEELWLKGEAA